MSVHAGPRRLVGLAVDVSDDSIAVQRSRGGLLFRRTDTLSFAVGSIARLDVSRGYSRAAGAKRWGLIYGIGAFAIIAVPSVSRENPELGLLLATYSGATTGLIGAAFGALFPPERWHRVR